MLTYDTLELAAGDVEVGTHSIWMPAMGIKVPFQFGGRLQKYRRPEEASYPLELLGEEVALLRNLSGIAYAPPIGDWVYFETVVSEHPGGLWVDPCGAYGYQMADAKQLPPGQFNIESFRASGLVEGSPGAWGDVEKPGNVVNGYLVDVRRSGFDRLRWLGDPVGLPVYQEDLQALEADLRRDGSFPFQDRPAAYQEYLLPDGWRPAERDVRKRAERLGFRPKPGETVLDLGCHTGGFLQYAAAAASSAGGRLVVAGRRLVGVDIRGEYIDLARRLARACGQNICYRVWNLAGDAGALVLWLASIGLRRPDHVLALSMASHLGEDRLWALLDAVGGRRVYLESNAAKSEEHWPLRRAVEERGGRYVGDSHDRNLRRLYVIES